jgi:hypothetical protein
LPFLLDTHKSSLNLSAYGVHSAKSAYDARSFRKIHYMNLPKYGLLELNLKWDYSSGCSLWTVLWTSDKVLHGCFCADCVRIWCTPISRVPLYEIDLVVVCSLPSQIVRIALNSNYIANWWRQCLKEHKQHHKNHQLSAGVYIVWHILKPRSRCVYDDQKFR